MRQRVASSLILLLVLAPAMLTGCASRPERPERKSEDLFAARRASDRARESERQQLMLKLLQRMEAEAAAARARSAGTRPAIDVLVISGGGDLGAFGAGVLKGWGRVSGDGARPKFDVVTGVSTGALIAPFAFLGDEASIDRIVKLYRNPQPDWVKTQGLVFFLPNNPSFFALPGLEREMRTNLDRPMLERIAAEDGTGRMLVVNTTNIDFGDMHPWDIVAETKTALARNDPEWVHRILLASAGMPAIFPARSLGDSLYVDGAVTGNILYGGHTKEEDSLPAQWRAKHPGERMPSLRYWVIFNNQLRAPPQVIQDRWPAIYGRAAIMATQTSTVNSMRHLWALAEVARLKYDADIQVRVIAIPEEWVPASPERFDKGVMNALADLGEKMGADPASWRTTAP